MLPAEPNYLADDIDYLIGENAKKPVDEPTFNISEYSTKRILPPNTPFPGQWNNNLTPYSVEIMNNMSVFSPVRHTAVMKGAQLGLTAAAENIIAYWMDEHPADVLYVSATQSLLEGWAIKRLEPLIDSCGFRRKIYAQTENRLSRRSGDKLLSKQFVGGNLDMVSAQSASSLRADSKRVVICDEIDGAPVQLPTGEGNWMDVVFARTNAWGPRKKILSISTPTTFANSLINQLYEAGDRRQYYIPCPYCKEMQVLKFGNADSAYGIKPERTAGVITGVYYECAKCHEAIRDYHKHDMLMRGEWRPSAVAVGTDKIRSYHLSALYSPVGMLSWAELWSRYEKALRTFDGMRSFVNLYLGKPFREAGARPDISKVIELRGAYKSGTVPDDVLYLTMGLDVQRGSDRDSRHPARLEFEILGIGAGYRTWSISYNRIEGGVDDPDAGAWLKLTEFAENGGLVFRRPNGDQIGVSLIFMDSGYNTDVVYRYVQSWTNTFACKGFSALKRRKNEQSDVVMVAGPPTFKRYRAAKMSGDVILYEVSKSFFLSQLYHGLNIVRRDIDPQPPGFCDFPIDYDERYFKMLTVAERRSDGSFRIPDGARAEALDCRIYALCAGAVHLDFLLMDFKSAAKANGATASELHKITHRTVIDLLVERRKKALQRRL